jgi:hypothetical protein
MNSISYAVMALVLVWVLSRQLRGRFVTDRSTKIGVLSLILVLFGLNEVWNAHLHWDAATVAVVAAGLVVSAGFGAARGAAVRLTERDGYLYQQGGWLLVLLWVVTIALRIGATSLVGAALAPAVGATVMISLAVTLVAQHAVLQARVRADGRPLLPDTSDQRAARAGARLER